MRGSTAGGVTGRDGGQNHSGRTLPVSPDGRGPPDASVRAYRKAFRTAA